MWLFERMAPGAKKVAGRTKTEVRDKLKELHREVESGLWLGVF
jgi:hypothetical protein